MINLREMLSENRSQISTRRGCLMAMVPKETSNTILQFTKQLINEDDLYLEGNEYGLETEGHVTIRYGYLKDLNELEIRQLLKGQKPFMMEIFGLDKFTNDPKYDVAMFKVSSPVLKRLNELSSKHLNEDNYTEYTPHLTLAYVQKGKFPHIKEGLRLKIPVDTICYSPISGDKSYFNLNEGNIHHDVDAQISRLEQEWDRLDSVGTSRDRQRDIEKELIRLRMEKERQVVQPGTEKSKSLFAQLKNYQIDEDEQLNEKQFRKSSKITHIMDVPMFSIFIDKKIENVLPEINLEEVKKRFLDAKNEIHKMGFPSMHVNVVISDLSKEVNYNTGDVGVGALAIHHHKYMLVDYKNIPTYYMMDIIIHEWAHLWMFNHSKEFKQAIKTLYKIMMLRSAGNMRRGLSPERYKIEPKKLTYEEEKKVFDIWVKWIENLVKFDIYDSTESLYILKNKKISPDLFKFLPHGLTVHGVLTKELYVSSLRNHEMTLPPGTDVYANKVNTGWIIGTEIDTHRYEVSIDGFNSIEYLKSKHGEYSMLNIIDLEFKKYLLRHKEYTTKSYLEKEILERLKLHVVGPFEDICKIFNYRPTIEDKKLIQSWVEQYIYPKYLEILKSKKLLDELKNRQTKSAMEKYIPTVYDFLWVSNELKPSDTSFIKFVERIKSIEISRQYHKDFTQKSNMSGKEFSEHREIMNKLNNWVSSYGMSNDDELWATAIQFFFKLPMNYKKTIIKLMTGI